MPTLRVLPLVIVAAALLLGLKAISFVTDGDTLMAAPAPPPTTAVDPAYRPVVAANLDAPPAAVGVDAHLAHDGDLVPPLDPTTTGSVQETSPSTPAAPDAAKVPPPKTAPVEDAAATAPADKLDATSTEAKLLKDLHDRQKTLNSEARQIDIRAALVKAAEKRLQAQVASLKAARAEATPPGTPSPAVQAKRMDALVAFYSGMRSKDAAVIFNRLDTSVLMEIATHMKARQFGEILGLMDPAAAERLTLALAGHGAGEPNAALDALPKIEGRPTPSR